MKLPLWVIFFLIIILVVIFFILFQTKYIRLYSWENKAKEILNSCGYNSIYKPIIIRSDKSYVTGKYNKEGIATVSTIHLKISKSEKRTYKDLIRMLSYITTPKSQRNTITYHKALEKISFCCYNKGYILDPFT